MLAGVLGNAGGIASAGVGVDKIAPVDPETARSACALVLAVLFASRTARKFGLVGKPGGLGLLFSRRVLFLFPAMLHVY